MSASVGFLLAGLDEPSEFRSANAAVAHDGEHYVFVEKEDPLVEAAVVDQVAIVNQQPADRRFITAALLST